MQSTHFTTWLERLYNLRRDKRGAHEKPHKPVLLLAVIELIEQGKVAENKIPLGDDLIENYHRLFEAVATSRDRPNPHLPLYHLSGDGFWHLVPQSGETPVYETGRASTPKSLKRLREDTQWAKLDSELWELLKNPTDRAAVREALIARYFAPFRNSLHTFLINAPESIGRMKLAEEVSLYRDAAFRTTIRQIYDFRCAACGIRIHLHTQHHHVLIEAAHIVPWEETQNDHPSNGLALCRNHHWAVDQNLIAPCPSSAHSAGIWRVSPILDDRIADHKSFVALNDRPVIAPSEKRFLPDREALQWRATRLRI